MPIKERGKTAEERKKSRKHNRGFIPRNGAGRRRWESRKVRVCSSTPAHTKRVVWMGLLQLAIEKETLQKPGVLIGGPTWTTISPTWRYGNFTILYNKCFPFNSLTIQLTYICACCTLSRSSAIVKRGTIQLNLHGFWPRRVRDKKMCVANTKTRRAVCVTSAEVGGTLLSRSFYIKFPAK